VLNLRLEFSFLERLANNFSVQFGYDVVFCDDVFCADSCVLREALSRLLGGTSATRTLWVFDEGLVAAQPDLVERVRRWCERNCAQLTMAGEPLVVPGGEPAKNDFEVTLKVIRAIRAAHLCRQSLVCIVGGGALLDAAGFAASMVHRGVRVVRFPSTVLSQNDSGVGVKNGINLRGVKNFLGTFAPPALVVNDFSLLRSLSPRDWISGVAEAFKVAIIKDADFLSWLVSSAPLFPARDEEAMRHLVRRCAELHVDHIRTSGDPFEFGSARPLDFGHWLGHKLESLSVGELRHGEAVSIGMCVDLLNAVQLGFVEQSRAENVIAALSCSGLPVWNEILTMTDGTNRQLVLNGIEEFREHLGGELYLTLPNPIGRRIEINELPEPVICESIKALEGLMPVVRRCIL
jgi:3-dehydroquinate synthase